MLILTRRAGEGFHIGDNVTIRILTMRNGVVRVAIEAPRDVPVDRIEVRERREGKQP